ncbi:zinc finger MYM-type protein 1-like [Artemia franciscana]|uniref:zinc finger MYM-type protein 1-like n=1 Tax=Artemia franciscana TaxID=6661 RepID=UPI0032DA18FC
MSCAREHFSPDELRLKSPIIRQPDFIRAACLTHLAEGQTATLWRHVYSSLAEVQVRPFIDIGVRKWKNISNVHEQHTRSDRHKDKAVSWTKFKAIQAKEMQPLTSVLMTDRNKEIKENREHVKTLLKVTALLRRLGTAFRGHDETESSTNKENLVETCNLLAKYSPTIFNKLQRRYGHYKSHEYQNDLQRTIVQELKSAKYFAVLVDETKGNLKKEQPAILLSYFEEGKLKERPIGCYHIKSLDAESLANFIHDTVTKIGMDRNYCVAQFYDGESVRSGRFSGVQARLRAKFPQAIYIHCLAHKLNLVVASCVESVSTVGTFFSLVQTQCTIISNSNTRHQLFVETQKAAELPVMELERSAATRWSYWYRSISTVRLRYE